MISRILYLCWSPYTAASVQSRYPKEIVLCKPLASATGHRGEVVVVEPLPLNASDGEREQYARLIKETAITKTRLHDTPLIIGEVQ